MIRPQVPRDGLILATHNPLEGYAFMRIYMRIACVYVYSYLCVYVYVYVYVYVHVYVYVYVYTYIYI